MSTPENRRDYYKSDGGSLEPGDKSYVKRAADQQLYDYLKAGRFCYVLNSRQMGKSSLTVRTMDKLKKEEGTVCAVINLQGIDRDTTAQWYKNIIEELGNRLKEQGLHIQINVEKWIDKQDWQSPRHKFKQFIEEEVLDNFPLQRIYIFLDEIDIIIGLELADNFFSLIKSCHDNSNSKYRNLTFVILGVATPYDLIQNKTQTVFNIGKAIELNGFKPDEVEPLTRGLQDKVDNPDAVIKQVLDWTGGQPFLTQKLCHLIVDYYHPIPLIAVGTEAERIEDLVQTKLIDNWESKDEPEHLRTIRDRLLRSNNFPASNLLKIYKQILQQGEIVANDSREQMELRLSGLVVKKDGKLKIYNKIYETIFNQDWVYKTLANLTATKDEISSENMPLSIQLDEVLNVSNLILNDQNQPYSNLLPIAQEICEALKAGEFCYVLSSPLTTKENLLMKIQEYFKNNNIPYAVIDSIQIDSNREASDFDFQWRGQWYSKVVAIIEKKFGLDYRAKEWWNKTKGEYKEDVPYACLFKKYLQCQLLHHKHDKNLVIIFDKIESIFDGLKFTEEIFTIIRDWYEQRRNNKNYKRLTFLMLGAAIPDGYEYKYHKSITGGWRTNLNNPSQPQVRPIVQKLEGKFRDIDPKVLLSRIWEWTNGHPVLTQKLFQLVLTDDSDLPEGQEAEAEYVDNLVKNIIKDCKV